MIGNLNTRQMRHLDHSKPCRPRYDYMGSVHCIGSEISTKATDGWQYAGSSIKQTEDGEGAYILARWRRQVAP